MGSCRLRPAPISSAQLLIEIHAAHAGIAAHAARARRRFRGFRTAIAGVRGKGRKLLFQVLLPAGGALDIWSFGGPADQLFKLRPTVFATVFVNRHGFCSYSTIRVQIRSMMPRTSAVCPP